MRYHRGFIRTTGKRAIDKFKGVPDNELRTFEEVQRLDSYAGILADGIVLLDFDIKEHSEIAYKIIKELDVKCRIYKSDKGYHFLMKSSPRFEKSMTRVSLACGIVCDIKLGSRNSYQSLKVDGREREMLQDCDETDVVPGFLSPINTEIDFVNMKAGEGRNSQLYSYLLTLQQHRFSRDESKMIVNIINQYVFDEPLPQHEIDTICRDEAFVPDMPSFIDEKGKFLHNIFGQYLIDTINIIKIDGVLHVYEDGIYVRGANRIEREMIQHIPNLTASRRLETYKYLDISIWENHEIANARYIAFRNGIYDVVTDKLLPFDPEIVLINKIPHDYDPNANDETMLKVMGNISCGNQDLFDLMCEMIGYTFWRKNELGWSFFLLGNRANGKSTFLSTLYHLLGDKNTSALDFQDIGKDFKSQELFGMLANIGDDISDDYISDTAVFKKVATGDVITVNPKYESPFKFRPYAKLIFSANNMPRLNDPTNAAARRIVPIPFKATFDKNSKDYDPFIKYKLQTEEAMSTLINLGIAGLKRVLRNNDFTHCEDVNNEIMNIEERNNPVISFLKDAKIENQLVDRVYSEYSWWAGSSGINAMSKPSFIKQVENYRNLKPRLSIVAGKEVTTFAKEV